MQLSNTIAPVIIGLLAFSITTYPALAGGGTGENPTPTDSSIQTTTSNITPSSSTPLGLSNSVTQFNQQSGIVQVANWGGSSNLTPPSCNGGCFFAVTRASPVTYGSGANVEAMVGVTIPIGSADGGAAELNRLNGEMQKYRTEHEVKLALSEKLADALENGKMERATIIAMNLAPMLGYKDYQLLLKAVSSSKPTNPAMGNR
jgi:hypothetical protein